MELAIEFVEWLEEKHPAVAQYFADYAVRMENGEASFWDYAIPLLTGGLISWLMILVSQWLG